jgi:hypothetical protein
MAIGLMVDEDLADTTLGDLQDGARDHGVAVEREHIVDDRALTERPALDGVSRSESLDDVHKPRISRPRISTIAYATLINLDSTTKEKGRPRSAAGSDHVTGEARHMGGWCLGTRSRLHFAQLSPKASIRSNPDFAMVNTLEPLPTDPAA